MTILWKKKKKTLARETRKISPNTAPDTTLHLQGQHTANEPVGKSESAVSGSKELFSIRVTKVTEICQKTRRTIVSPSFWLFIVGEICLMRIASAKVSSVLS